MLIVLCLLVYSTLALPDSRHVVPLVCPVTPAHHHHALALVMQYTPG